MTSNAVGEKRCTNCDVLAPLADFPPAGHHRDGRSSWCRPCHREATRA